MFKFSLQTVLEVRERFEKIKYKEYSGELMRYHQMEQEKVALGESLHRAAEANDRAKASSLSAQPFMLFEKYRDRIKTDMGRIEARMREQKEVVDLKRTELVEARRQHRALEILREKEKARYLQNQAKMERAMMDEVASVHYVLKG